MNLEKEIWSTETRCGTQKKTVVRRRSWSRCFPWNNHLNTYWHPKKVNKIFFVIRKGTEKKTEGNILPLYKAGEHPHCERYVQVSFPQIKKGIVEVDKKHKRATKVTAEIKWLLDVMKTVGKVNLEVFPSCNTGTEGCLTRACRRWI